MCENNRIILIVDGGGKLEVDTSGKRITTLGNDTLKNSDPQGVILPTGRRYLRRDQTGALQSRNREGA